MIFFRAKTHTLLNLTYSFYHIRVRRSYVPFDGSTKDSQNVNRCFYKLKTGSIRGLGFGYSLAATRWSQGSGPPSGQNAGSTRDRTVLADLRASSLFTVSPTLGGNEVYNSIDIKNDSAKRRLNVVIIKKHLICSSEEQK
ncbi:polyprotein [Plakobranchus ocellatus]|uniref:Polyprotein n=1 Tax=Plakobranchus ocellatus TaxID=259542 RepID=A0AAV3YIV4_9GAST|nr:polyprotein [Plakobranchus ocellatus]